MEWISVCANPPHVLNVAQCFRCCRLVDDILLSAVYKKVNVVRRAEGRKRWLLTESAVSICLYRASPTQT